MRRIPVFMAIFSLSAAMLMGCGTTSSETEVVSSMETDEQSEDLLLIENIGTRRSRSLDSTYITVSYDQLGLTEEYVSDYPELQRAIESSFNAPAEEMAERFYQSASSDTELIDADRLYCEITGNAVRADSVVVSLERHYEYYGGGAHPFTEVRGYTFDAQTGSLLSVDDVVTDRKALLDAAKEKIQEKYEYSEWLNLDRIDEWKDVLPEEILWSISSVGLNLYFNAYELGSYADGPQYVTITFGEYPELFEERYTDVPDHYVLYLLPDEEAAVDIDQDGSVDSVSVKADYTYANASEADYAAVINGISVSTGHGLGMDAYIVYSDQQYYLYMSHHDEDSFRILYVVDPENKSCERYEEEYISLAGNYSIEYESAESGEYADHSNSLKFTDPERFICTQKTDLLGTYQSYQYWHTGEGGLPERSKNWNEVHSSRVICLNSDLACNLASEDGTAVTGTDTIPAGSYLYFVRTDGNSWADVQIIDPDLVRSNDTTMYPSYAASLEDTVLDPSKDTYRITVDTSSYPRLVDGVDENTVFSGITYAG